MVLSCNQISRFVLSEGFLILAGVRCDFHNCERHTEQFHPLKPFGGDQNILTITNTLITNKLMTNVSLKKSSI